MRSEFCCRDCSTWFRRDADTPVRAARRQHAARCLGSLEASPFMDEIGADLARIADLYLINDEAPGGGSNVRFAGPQDPPLRNRIPPS